MSRVNKTRIYLYIAVLMLASVACGVSAGEKLKVYQPTETATPPAVLEMVVIADALNIRADADYNSAADPVGLRKGEKVKVYLACTGGEVREWVSLNRDCTRWVKASWLEAR